MAGNNRPALLTTLLLPKLYAAASTQSTSPRVVFVSSDAHRDAALPRKTLEASSVLRHISSREGSLPYNLIHKYRLAKLINVLFARALSAHLAPPPSSPTSRPPIVNSVDPGLCYSEMTRGATAYLVFRMAMSVLARTAEEGARQLIWASIGSPGASTALPSDPSDLDGEAALRGAFISSMKIRKPGGLASREKGREFEQLLWDDTLKILAAVDERVPLIIKDYLS
ncbi:hypothetical protein ONZ45_g19301 [Pleurotus djamor]|nr:hypothetical protein ONZ45_g19301 [Pleurotus djamor]